jgi:hypothetical protein
VKNNLTIGIKDEKAMAYNISHSQYTPYIDKLFGDPSRGYASVRRIPSYGSKLNSIADISSTISVFQDKYQNVEGK